MPLKLGTYQRNLMMDGFLGRGSKGRKGMKIMNSLYKLKFESLQQSFEDFSRDPFGLVKLKEETEMAKMNRFDEFAKKIKLFDG